MDFLIITGAGVAKMTTFITGKTQAGTCLARFPATVAVQLEASTSLGPQRCSPCLRVTCDPLEQCLKPLAFAGAVSAARHARASPLLSLCGQGLARGALEWPERSEECVCCK